LNSLLEKYPQEIERILAKYPPDQKRAAVMGLIYLAQREKNYITKQSLIDIGEILDLSATDVGSLVGYYTLYHGEPQGMYRIQVCNDLPCALRGADEFLEKLCENVGIQVGETTPDGLITIEAVMCLAGCNHAPLFQVQSGDDISYHEDQTVETALEFINQLRSQEPAKEITEAGERSGPTDLPDLNVPVLPIAVQGTTILTREERVRLMEEGGQ